MDRREIEIGINLTVVLITAIIAILIMSIKL